MPDVTLAEFLTARLDDRAREAERLRNLADRVGSVYGSPEPPDDDMSLGDLAYFAMHGAADRLVAEVEAKRRILSLHAPERVWTGDAMEPDNCTSCLLWESQGYSKYESAPCPTVRLLALPDATHPDYQQEWRPADLP